MRGVSGAILLGVARHCALLQRLDPLDFSLKTVANVDGKPRVLGVENVPLGAAFEGVSVLLDEVFKSKDSTVELLDFGFVIVFALFECLEQRLGDALQGVGVEVSAHVENIGR